MSRIKEAAEKFFKDDEWNYSPAKDRPDIIGAEYSGDSGIFTVYFHIDDEKEQLLFYSILPKRVPEEKAQKMVEFLTRANDGTVIGNFEMDLSDGEIKYKTSINIEGIELSNALIKPIVHANVLAMDEYIPYIDKVMATDISPEEVIKEKEVEGRKIIYYVL